MECVWSSKFMVPHSVVKSFDFMILSALPSKLSPPHLAVFLEQVQQPNRHNPNILLLLTFEHILLKDLIDGLYQVSYPGIFYQIAQKCFSFYVL